MPSKDDVRDWARQQKAGIKLTETQKDAVKRTADQAGLEGKRIKRILKGEPEE